MIEIVLKSYNKLVLSSFIEFIKSVYKNEVRVVNLPNKISKITLLRSPHVYKKSKVSYQEKIYKVILFIDAPNVNLLLFSNIPKSILLKIKNS